MRGVGGEGFIEDTSESSMSNLLKTPDFLNKIGFYSDKNPNKNRLRTKKETGDCLQLKELPKDLTLNGIR